MQGGVGTQRQAGQISDGRSVQDFGNAKDSRQQQDSRQHPEDLQHTKPFASQPASKVLNKIQNQDYWSACCYKVEISKLSFH